MDGEKPAGLLHAGHPLAAGARADPVLTPYESQLAAALAPETPPKPEELKASVLAFYAKFALFDGTVHQKLALHLHLEGLLASLATKTMPTQMIKTDRMTVEHSGSVDAGGGGPTADKRLAHITLKQNAAEDRAYIESCFGRSLYPPERLRKAEQELCTGDHLGCHLWFASGVPSPEQAPTPGSEASGRAGRIAGRPQPRLLCQKSGAAPQRGAAADRADPQLHPRAPAAQRRGWPAAAIWTRAGLARPA